MGLRRPADPTVRQVTGSRDTGGDASSIIARGRDVGGAGARREGGRSRSTKRMVHARLLDPVFARLGVPPMTWLADVLEHTPI